jgi:HEAT repeat protein
MDLRHVAVLLAALALPAGCAQNELGRYSGYSTSPKPSGPPALDPEARAALMQKAETVLAQALQSGQPLLQAEALQTFLEAGRPAPALDLEKLTDPRVHMLALVLGARQHNAAALALLRPSLRDADPSVRLAAAFGLALGGDGAQATALRDGLASNDVAVRRNAAWLLGLMDNKSAVDMLKARLDDPDAAVALRVAEALSRLGSADGLETVRTLTEHERHPVRYWATQLLGRLGTTSDIPRLNKLCESRFLDVKLAAIGSLAQLGDFRRIGLLLDLIEAPEQVEEASATDVRLLAAHELGETGYTPAAASLGRLMARTDVQERTAAAAALVRILSETRPWRSRALVEKNLPAGPPAKAKTAMPWENPSPKRF